MKTEYNGFKIEVRKEAPFHLYINDFHEGTFSNAEDALEHAKNEIDIEQDPYPRDAQSGDENPWEVFQNNRGITG